MTTTTPNGVDVELVQVLKDWLDVPRQESERYDEEAARYRTRLAKLRGITEGELICAVEDARRDRRAFPAMSDAEQRLDHAREEEIRATNAAVLARREELSVKTVSLAKAIVRRMRDLPSDVRAQLGSTAIRELAAGRTEPRESLYDTEPRVPKNVRGALEELELISVELGAEKPTQEEHGVCTHSEDFISVTWYGTKLPSFSSKQAQVIEVLWQAWESGNAVVSEAYIAERLQSDGAFTNEDETKVSGFSVQATMRTQSRGRNGEKRNKPHPAMGLMIHRAARGRWQLAPPPRTNEAAPP